MHFPDESLVYRLSSGGRFARTCAVVALVEIDGPKVPFGFAGVQVLTGATKKCGRHPREGWTGCTVPFFVLEPLTLAAEEFLEGLRMYQPVAP